jgi:hypothetical protein
VYEQNAGRINFVKNTDTGGMRDKCVRRGESGEENLRHECCVTAHEFA